MTYKKARGFSSFFIVEKGWAKTVQPLMFDRRKCKTQWLIGIFVRLLSSKDDLINCAGVGRRTLFNLSEFFPTPFELGTS